MTFQSGDKVTYHSWGVGNDDTPVILPDAPTFTGVVERVNYPFLMVGEEWVHAIFNRVRLVERVYRVEDETQRADGFDDLCRYAEGWG